MKRGFGEMLRRGAFIGGAVALLLSAGQLPAGENLTVDGGTTVTSPDADAEFAERLAMMGIVFSGSVSPASYSGNTVTVENTFADPLAMYTSIYGGAISFGDDDITGNSLTVDANAEVGRAVAGNAKGSGSIYGNYVSFAGKANGVSAAYATDGDAYDNTVDILTGAEGVSVSGGQSITGTAYNNTLNISGGKVAMAFGGSSDSNSVFNNKVVVTGGIIDDMVMYGLIPIPTPMLYGGFSMGGGDASGNSVDFSNAVLGNAIDNYGTISGGYAAAGNAANNSLVIRSGSIYGGSGNVGQGVYGGMSAVGDAIGNNIDIVGGMVSGDAAGGLALAGNARNNIVTVSGGTLDVALAAGFSQTGGDATGNILNITNGIFLLNEGSGGGSAVSGNATGNVVNMSGGFFDGILFGGMAGFTTEGYATDNTVNITGGTVDGKLVGGAVVLGSATNNTVRIAGAPNLANATLIGGLDYMELISGTGFATDVVSGNRLFVDGFKGQIAGAEKFAEYSFNLSDVVANDVILDSTAPIDLGGSSITLSNVSGIQMQEGQSVQLFTNAANYAGDTTLTAAENIAVLHDFTLSQSGTAILSSYRGERANPQSKALAEMRSASLSFLNQASDMHFGSGMDAALAASRNNSAWTAFVAAEGMDRRTTTGSHVDVSGFSLMTGFAKGFCTGSGRLTATAFFEAGWGSYDSYNSFTGMASVKGEGDTNYYGGGFMVEADLPAGFYAQGSFHGGWSETDFDSRDIIGATNGRTSFDSDTGYWGAGLKLGHVWQPTACLDVDFSAAYLWNRQNSDRVTVDRQSLRFDASNSHRVRGGVRVEYAASEWVSPFVGAAYEYEFAGKAEGSLAGRRMDSPRLQGSTGIGEIGLRINPKRECGFAMDAVLQGYVGRNRGVSGGVRLGWAF